MTPIDDGAKSRRPEAHRRNAAQRRAALVHEAPSGARVRLEVTNRTAAAIEFESFELNRERVIQPGQTAAVYVSGLGPGRYEFFDDFHQQRRGALLVR